MKKSIFFIVLFFLTFQNSYSFLDNLFNSFEDVKNSTQKIVPDIEIKQNLDNDVTDDIINSTIEVKNAALDLVDFEIEKSQSQNISISKNEDFKSYIDNEIDDLRSDIKNIDRYDFSSINEDFEEDFYNKTYINSKFLDYTPLTLMSSYYNKTDTNLLLLDYSPISTFDNYYNISQVDNLIQSVNTTSNEDNLIYLTIEEINQDNTNINLNYENSTELLSIENLNETHTQLSNFKEMCIYEENNQTIIKMELC